MFIRIVEQARHQGTAGPRGTGESHEAYSLPRLRKELTQILRDRLALALALVLPLIQFMLMRKLPCRLSVNDLPIIVQDLDNSIGFPSIYRRLPRLDHLSHRPVAVGQTTRAGAYVQYGPGRPHHPDALWEGHGPWPLLAGAVAGGRL